MNKERLKHLVTILEDINPREFYMGTFGHRDECGTCACAAGYATLDPLFRSQGLHPYARDDLEPVFDNSYGWKALTRFFEIDNDQANYLFLETFYNAPVTRITPAMVVDRINILLSEACDG